MRRIAAVVLGCALVAGAALLAWAPPSVATYLPDERIPTEDAIYRDLERLAARFGEAPRFLSSRPLRRAEALAYLDALTAAHTEAAEDPAARRARRALDPASPGGHPALITAQGENGERAEISPYVSLLYSEDKRNLPEINRDYRAGAAFAGAFDSSVVMVADIYAGTASQGGRGTPNFGTFNSLVEGVDFNTWVDEAYVEARLGRVRLLAGHAWLRWGPGQDGTLALSDAAPALDMVRAEVTAFRSWRLQWFVSMLDPGPQTYLAGHRLEWSPCGRLTAGFTELARFDGTSQAPLYAMPMVPYSFWEKRPKSGTAGAIPGDSTGVALAKNNVLWSADVSWTPTRGWRAWGELMVDDISFSRDYKPDLIGYQAGVEHRRAVRGGRDAVGASVEYNRVNNYTYSAFHGHHFEHEGFPLGFELGPDVASLEGEIAYERGAAWEFAVRGEWRKKGEGAIGDYYDKPAGGSVDASAFAGTIAEEARLSGRVAFQPSRRASVIATIGTSRHHNFQHEYSRRKDDTPVTIRGEFAW
ncbi:MAG TPA: capsule assembly Wzi family protein [Candidatus Eisenbacteria bacterium]|nr:capsule assembly Wzi family protein [Candidatus Eisenbacteria bacterium]